MIAVACVVVVGSCSGDARHAGPARDGTNAGEAGAGVAGRRSHDGSAGEVSGGSAASAGGSAGEAAAGEVSRAGDGGAAGEAGQSANSGGAGGEDMEPASKLGQPCNADRDCVSSRGLNLICLEADDVSGGNAPPHGLCTTPCELDEDCEEHSAGALCALPVGEVAYCIQGCSYGDQPEAEKCHGRVDFVCAPAGLIDLLDPCANQSRCDSDEICMDSAGVGYDTCHALLPGCLPDCQGDNDCAPGLHCDGSVLGGGCVAVAPAGKAFGESCAIGDEHPDECIGACLPLSLETEEGTCTRTCALGSPCAYDSASARYQGVCRYPSSVAPGSGRGDFGYCAPACDCTEDCENLGLACIAARDGIDLTQLTGAGSCDTEDSASPEDILHTCDAGAAGAGGAPVSLPGSGGTLP